MAYLAIARKWRPTRFEDLVGQEHVVQTLRNAIQYKRVSHAYLFSGARGVGKTTVARIFASELRAPKSDASDAAERERQSIVEGRCVDVIEIDGASNNGVEAVRGLRENVAYSPSSGDLKVYIIDEVHMLSISAFNALLKTLEEPPEHVIFLFATTEAQKIPLTILSRCQHFEFRRLTNQQIVGRLKEILTEENVSLTEEALRTIASYGDGSLRDSLSLLDQVLSFFGEEATRSELDEPSVVKALGVSESSTIASYLESILSKDITKALKVIEDTYHSGVDLKRFGERSLEELRHLYLIRLGMDEKQMPDAQTLDLSSGHFSTLERAAENANLLQLERMAQILGKTIQQLSWSSLPRFALEMATVRMAKLDELAAVEAALLNRTPPAAAPQKRAPLEQTPAQAKSAPQPVRTQPTPAAPQGTQAPVPPRRQEPPPSVPTHAGGTSWKNFVSMVITKKPLLGSLLNHAEFKLEESNGSKIVNLAFAKDSFFERSATEKKNREDIGAFVKEYFGHDVELEINSAKEGMLRSIEHSQQEQLKQRKSDAINHPAVNQVKEALDADIVGVNVELGD